VSPKAKVFGGWLVGERVGSANLIRRGESGSASLRQVVLSLVRLVAVMLLVSSRSLHSDWVRAVALLESVAVDGPNSAPHAPEPTPSTTVTPVGECNARPIIFVRMTSSALHEGRVILRANQGANDG
jgi:hypothetical protein